MQKMICMVLGLVEVPTPDDAADALAIAVTCAHTNSFEKIEI
ncbi:MAG: crossover junction endodeoxyribonuclease RuvC [Patescibacteria group bacterium]